jgi:purine-binding chemotaxis protein CheW
MTEPVAPTAGPARGAPRELLAFCAAGQDFCVDIMAVGQIRGWSPTTILPHAPAYVLGVLNLRGSVVPVVDLAGRLGLGSVTPTARHVVIVVQIGEQTAGLLVETVSDILSVPAEAIQPTPGIASAEVRGAIAGVIVAGEQRMLRLLDLDGLLAPRPQEMA